MRRSIALLTVVVLTFAACSDEASEPTSTTAPPETTTTTGAPETTTTTAAAETTTTTQPAETTTTSSLPSSEPNPELEALAGIWTNETVNSWSIRLDGYTIVAGGNPTNLVIPGSVDMEDGVLSISGITTGWEGCDETVGRYTAVRDGDTLTIGLIEDACEERAEVMPGMYALVE